MMTVLHENLSLLPPTLRTSQADGPEIPEHVMLPAVVSGSAHAGGFKLWKFIFSQFRGLEVQEQ